VPCHRPHQALHHPMSGPVRPLPQTQVQPSVQHMVHSLGQVRTWLAEHRSPQETAFVKRGWCFNTWGQDSG
jgi:hypothetical protein